MKGFLFAADISQKYAQEADRLVAEAVKIRAAKQAELEKQKLLYPGKFIVEHIPKYRIDMYQGNVAVLPQPLADKALDWMKKEYRIP